MFKTLKSKAQRLSLGLAGGLCALTGLALLTVAGWIALAAIAGHQTAALVFGAAYLGAGLILMGLARNRTQPPQAKLESAPAQDPVAAVMAGFMQGVQAGARRS